MREEFGSLIPKGYVWKMLFPTMQEVIVINWLDLEIDMNIEINIPLLREIAGYRNKEVYKFVGNTKDHRSEENAKAIYLCGYGPGACV